MPRYFAQLNNQGVVERVIVADSLDWCVKNLGGDWMETFMDNPDKNYAGRGHKYDSTLSNFVSEKPFDSWVLNEKAQWEAPIPRPKNSGSWNEEEGRWNALEEDKVILNIK